MPIADCRLPIADCRLPIADCRLPIADCRLPIADCRFYGSGVCGQVGLFGLCHVFSSRVMPMTSATDKSHYTHKNPNIKFFCKKICHSRPRLREGRLRRESTRRKAANTAAAKPPVVRRGFYIPVILATAGIHPFAIFLCAKAQTAIYRRKWQTPCGGESRRKFPPPLAALISAAFCGATHSRIFPSCFARWFALRANGKNVAIIAHAIMTAPKARLDSRRSLPSRRRGRE